jgi:hypothetical protein
MTSSTVRCRVRVSKACTHGKPLMAEFGDPEQGLPDDGTYRESDDSVVCNACYIVIGTPNNPVAWNAPAVP